MPRRFSTREVVGVRERKGFEFQRQVGRHMRYQGFWRGQVRHVTLVEGQRPIPARTLTSILKQTGLSAGELLDLIEGRDVKE